MKNQGQGEKCPFPGPHMAKNKAGTRQSMTFMEPLFKEVETPPDKSSPGVLELRLGFHPLAHPPPHPSCLEHLCNEQPVHSDPGLSQNSQILILP